MQKLRLKFVWGASERIKGEWHLGLWGWYDRLPGHRHSGLAISLRGLLRWMAGLAVAIYLSGATALYFSFRRNPYNLVTWTDAVLLPVRWQHVKELRGRMMIEEGLAALKQQRWAEAVMKLRLGLTRAPHDWRARLALGQFYTVANQRVNALEVLTGDFDFGYPGRRYLETLFAIATEGEDTDVILAACERFAGEKTDAAWLKTQRSVALLRAHRAQDVLKLLPAEDQSWADTDWDTKVTALIELKRPEEAVAELDRWEKVPRHDQALVAKLRVRALRDAGRVAEMTVAAAKYRALLPAEPRALAFVIAQTWMAGEQAEAGRLLDDFFRRFSAEEQNLMTVVKAAGDAKAAPLVARCAAEAGAHGFNGKGFKSALVAAQVACGEWALAQRTMAELKAVNRKPDPGEAFQQEWMMRLLALAVAPNESPPQLLLELFQQRPISMRVYRQSAEVLVQARRFAAAREVLELAERVYANSRSLEELRAQVDEALKPPPAAAPVAAAPVTPVAQAEREFFDRLEAAEKEQRWTDAAQAIREVRIAKPRWFAARETELLERQVRLAFKESDTVEAVGAVRLLLDGSATRANRVVILARELVDAGDRAGGLIVVQEVLRRNPGFPMAVRLKSILAPEPVAPAKTAPAGAPPAAKPVAKPASATGG